MPASIWPARAISFFFTSPCGAGYRGQRLRGRSVNLAGSLPPGCFGELHVPAIRRLATRILGLEEDGWARSAVGFAASRRCDVANMLHCYDFSLILSKKKKRNFSLMLRV